MVGVYHLLTVEKDKDHLFNAIGDDFGHGGTSCALFNPLPGLKIYLWTVHGHRHSLLVHSDNVAQEALPFIINNHHERH
jgi:hypothetical protein